MADWILKDNVEVRDVFKKLDISGTYLLKLAIPKGSSIFKDEYEIYIQDSNLFKDLAELKNGKRERCYFAYGMPDIDFYKLKDQYAITHSPHEGLNVQLILANGQFETLLNTVGY